MAGCLLGVMVGDALGAVWEAEAPATGVAAAHARLAWGGRTLRVTDDSVLTLALAEHLLVAPLVQDAAGWATAMADAYDADRGFGRGFSQLVELWRDGVEVEAAATRVFADGSHGNGAAMRAAPVGLRWPDDDEARRTAAMNQAIVSHAHPIGMDGSIAIAEAVAIALRTGSFTTDDVEQVAAACRTPAMRDALRAVPAQVEAWCTDEVTLADAATTLGTSAVAERSVPAAVWAACAGESLTDAVALAVGLGGDTDTIASMAAAIRAAAEGRDAIPPDWLLALEDGDTGLTRALAAAESLVPPSSGDAGAIRGI